MDEDSKASATTPEKTNPESVASSDHPATQVENNTAIASGSCSESSDSVEHVSSGEKISTEQVNQVADALESVALAGSVSENKGEKVKGPHVVNILNSKYCNGACIVSGELTTEKLLIVHRVADQNNDVQLADFIESEFLTEQVEAVKKISEYVARLRRVGKGHGVWHFDQMLLNEAAIVAS